MKHLICAIVFLQLSFLNAQIIFNIGSNDYYEARLYLEDGTSKIGF
ncbi:hypothetical protein [Moheibacter lacus]|uniref:Uncharacterized protein n=1 Tax=Moheibacter lacus TaxID=2745851 RepID=A0A838ZMB5_9FLAO|nr:hypothetical protein [Moheibacter lacus]MBA5628187.1 hypothetical protein [Moheibacter lacus]